MRYLPGDILLVLFALGSMSMRFAQAAESEHQAVLFEVRLNGELVADNALLLQDSDGRLLALVEDLEHWRLRPPPGPQIIEQGEAFAALDDLHGLSYAVDPTTLVLEIDAPAELFAGTVLQARRTGPLPQSGTGGYLNYDLLYEAGDDRTPQLDGVFEAVVFRPHDLGVVAGDMLAEDLGDGPEFTRLQTSWSKDLVEARQSVVAGDAITAGTILSRPLRFGGVRWTTKFATDPTFITFPIQTIAGLAEQPSVVEVLVNDALLFTTEVPRGPFELERTPGVTGQSEVQLVVTDLLGREQVITESLFISPENLAAGLSDFSYEAGVLRQEFGVESFDYDDPFAAATYRYGITDELTGEAHVEFQDELQGAGLGGILVVSGVGRFRANLSGSRYEDLGWGSRQGLSYEYIDAPLNLTIGTEYTTADFRRLGDDINVTPTARIDRAGFGLTLGQFGSIGLSYVNQEFREQDDQSLIVGSYNLGLPFGTLLISGTQTFEPDSNSMIGFTIVVPLGGDRTISTDVDFDDAGRRERVDYQKSLGSTEVGYSYRIGAERDEDVRRYSGDFVLQTTVGRMTASAVRIDHDDSARLGVSGSVALMGGDLFASRPILQSFAVVDAGGIEDITVYRENREVGTTDADGRIMIPDLRPYEANRLALESSDIPFEATVESLEETAVPYDRSGVLVEFPVRVTRSATLTVVDAAGDPVPSGSRIRSEDGRIDTRIANEGLAYLTDLGIGEERFVVTTRGVDCTLVLAVPEDLGLLPHLGQVVCR